ncbi:heme biosynthesis HemY N-terminal domain-containing protein [Halothiobacillus sp. DCM-1]|uniref:heme biosynthesis HemY N-terminal domain-containing protein n=1 Tax=Halothiobacillus sp. DCM-1 TaxID=3112558 RepID=UPI0032534FE9
MKRLFVIFFGLVLVGLAALYFLRDPGSADISLLGWQLHTTALGFLALVAGLMIVLALVWRLIAALLRLPAFFRARGARTRRQRADDALLRAFAESSRGQFAEAETLAMSHWEEASVGAMHFVIALDAAFARGDTAAALARLDQARATYPRFAGYLALHLANQLSNAGQHGTAIELLQGLHGTHPQDEAVLLALARALYAGEDWQKLQALMPALRRVKSARLSEQTLWQWERGQLLGRLPALVRSGQADGLRAWRNEVPKKLKTDPGLVQAQAQAALALQQPQEAQQMLERALEQSPNAVLLQQWLALPLDVAAATAWLDRLLANHPEAFDRNTIGLAQARLALNRQDLAAAQSWLAPVLTQDAEPAAYLLAAELAEQQRDSATACTWYAKALARRAPCA